MVSEMNIFSPFFLFPNISLWGLLITGCGQIGPNHDLCRGPLDIPLIMIPTA